MSTLRTFIAIAMPASIKRQVEELQFELRKFQEGISWSKPGNIHLTLKFLGDVEEAKVDAIAAALGEVVAASPPFSFHLKHLGMFPNKQRPRVLWIGLDEPSKQLIGLAKNIDQALIKFGFSPESRKFTPHLTLGRVRSQPDRSFLEAYQQIDFDAGSIPVNEVILMRSELRPSGSVYTPLARFSARG